MAKKEHRSAKKKSRNNFRLNYFILVFGLVGFLSFLTLNTKLFWKTYKSEDAQMFFRYPAWWNLSTCRNLGERGLVKKIAFAKECYISPSRGYITVTKVNSPSDQLSYLEENYGSFLGATSFSKYQLGNAQGFTKKVEHVDEAYRLGSGKVFYVLVNEKVYEITFRDTDPKTIKIILSSFEFL